MITVMRHFRATDHCVLTRFGLLRCTKTARRRQRRRVAGRVAICDRTHGNVPSSTSTQTHTRGHFEVGRVETLYYLSVSTNCLYGLLFFILYIFRVCSAYVSHSVKSYLLTYLIATMSGMADLPKVTSHSTIGIDQQLMLIWPTPLPLRKNMPPIIWPIRGLSSIGAGFSGNSVDSVEWLWPLLSYRAYHINIRRRRLHVLRVYLIIMHHSRCCFYTKLS